MKKIIIPAFILCFAVTGFSSEVFAKNDNGHGKGRGHGARAEKNISAEALIGVSNRETIKLFLRENYGKKCPPGLAKKNNGCLPPGIAKKYTIGRALPADVIAASLPDELLKLLYPARYGQKYVQVDKDILLIDQATRKVLDAVTLISAVGQ